MTTSLALLLVVAHFAGDWFLQNRHIATHKAKDPRVLLRHVLIVTACLVPVALWCGLRLSHDHAMAWAIQAPLVALLINGVAHGMLDWFGWRAYNRRFSTFSAAGHLENRWFWWHIAGDQLAHLAILFALFGHL